MSKNVLPFARYIKLGKLECFAGKDVLVAKMIDELMSWLGVNCFNAISHFAELENELSTSLQCYKTETFTQLIKYEPGAKVELL